MTSKQLLHMLCGYYGITEKQIVYFLQEKIYKNRKSAGIMPANDNEFVDEVVIYSIINDVIISIIVEDEND